MIRSSAHRAYDLYRRNTLEKTWLFNGLGFARIFCQRAYVTP
jgi:hypothetical protein